MVRFHSDIDLWKKAYALTLEVYRVTRSFPREEVYGLTAQLRRAAVGVTANLAEGSARQSRREYLHFCYIARGSSTEVETLLQIALDLGLLNTEDQMRLGRGYKDVSMMLTNLAKSLRAGSAS